MLLYKYLTPLKVEDWLIKENVILLTPPIFLNDISEFRVKREAADEAELRKMFAQFQLENPTTLKFEDWASSVGSDQFQSAEPEEMREKLSQIFGVLSLSENPLSELMWAHYGLNRGVAIGYAAVDETVRHGLTARFSPFGPAFRVCYDNVPPILKKDFSNAPQLLTRKRRCWKYEDEWRVVGELKNAIKFPQGDKNFYGMPAQKDQIKHVVFGVASTPGFRKSVIEWLGEGISNVQTVMIHSTTNEFFLEELDV